RTTQLSQSYGSMKTAHLILPSAKTAKRSLTSMQATTKCTAWQYNRTAQLLLSDQPIMVEPTLILQLSGILIRAHPTLSSVQITMELSLLRCAQSISLRVSRYNAMPKLLLQVP